MTSKEKFEYWWKIIFLAIFGLAAGFAACYTLFALPLSVLTIFYFIGMGAGCAFSFWAVVKLTKEYFYWKNKEKEENKQE